MAEIESIREILHILIDQIDDEKVLKHYQTILADELHQKHRSDWWDKMPDPLKARLQISLKQLKTGKTKDLKTVLDNI